VTVSAATHMQPPSAATKSESCLNSVKKDGNFLRDESSHEASTDDGSFKEENGKGEGEKKRVSIIYSMFYRNIF